MPSGIDLFIFDGPSTNKKYSSIHHVSRLHDSASPVLDMTTMISRSGMSYPDTINIFGHQMAIVCVPSTTFMAARTTWQPWITGTVCALFTCVISLYLLKIAIGNAINAKNAAQISAANEQLQSEIAERKNVDESLHRENAKLSAMLSAMEEGIVFADANDTIIEINDYLCDFLGKKREDIIGKRLYEIHDGAMLEKVLARIEPFRKKSPQVHSSFSAPSAARKLFSVYNPLYRNEKYDGVLLNVIDVSELVKARQQAEIANRTKGKFLANMSHEIRTPMTAILGYTDLLMDPKIDRSTSNNYLMIVRRNSENLLHLINDILDLSKIEAGKLTLTIQQCSLVSVLADVCQHYSPASQPARKHPECGLPDRTPRDNLHRLQPPCAKQS